MGKKALKPNFGTDGWRAIIGEGFSIENSLIVIKSLLNTFQNRRKKFAIGYDTRFLSSDIAYKLSNYLINNGHEVYISESPVPTPTVSFTVKNMRCDFGIIITASHNSYEWNGIKIKNSEGQSIDDKVVKKISNEIENIDLDKEDYKKLTHNSKNNQINYEDFISPYIDSIKKLIDINKIKKAKLKVVVDCMFGTSISILNRILGGDDCNIIEINNNINPNFPGIKQPEPISQNLKRLKSTVTELNADIGFGFDADSDRVGVVDNMGLYIDAPYVFCSISDHILGNREEVKSFCTTVSMTSMADKIADFYNIDCIRTKIGFKYVAPAMSENNSILGGEESGGYSYAPHLNERDGTISALLLLEQLVHYKFDANNLYSSQKEKYGKFFFKRTDLTIKEESKENLIKYIKDFNSKSLFDKKIKSIDKKDGLKITLNDDTWVLLRLSGTEPVARIYCESLNEKNLNDLITKFKNQIKT